GKLVGAHGLSLAAPRDPTRQKSPDGFFSGKSRKERPIPAWSNDSTEDALLRARERAQGIAEHFQSTFPESTALDPFSYPCELELMLNTSD
ncbi:MAG: hypothetical protein WBW78_04575, partial [Terrimicrobiaceae bacterium]